MNEQSITSLLSNKGQKFLYILPTGLKYSPFNFMPAFYCLAMVTEGMQEYQIQLRAFTHKLLQVEKVPIGRIPQNLGYKFLGFLNSQKLGICQGILRDMNPMEDVLRVNIIF